jgi:phage-related protein
MTMQQPPGWTIEFYTDARGKSAVVEFISGLPERERAKARNYLRLLREFGILLGMPYARPVSGHRKLWELRPGAIRLFYFAHTGRRFIILHAFRKKSQKTPRREITTAEQRMAEFLERGTQ